MKNRYAKSIYLARLNLRRDWLKIMVWIIGLVGLMAGAATKFDSLYGTHKAMLSIISTLKTPAMTSLLGPFTASKPYSPALIYAAEMMVFMGLFVAIMNIYFAVRNTRAEEDNGVTELMRARAVGRQSPLTGVIIELLVINLLAGVLEALGLQAAGMTGDNVMGNWLFGLGLAAFGFMFGTISLLMAQIVSDSRSATMLSYLILGILFVARMGTDVQNVDQTWCTIFGWIEKLDIYGINDWTAVWLMMALSVACILLTFGLSVRRDVGAGMLPERNGRRRASFLLAGPLTLISRLERTSFIVWLVSLVLLGASYGSIFGNIGDILKTNPAMSQLLGTDGVHAANRAVILAFAGKLAVIFVIVATIPALMAILKINGDEKKGWLEQVHAKPVSRLRLFSSYSCFALVIGTLSQLLGVWGMAVVGNASMTHGGTVSLAHLMRAFVGFWPAMFVVMGIAVLLVSVWPRIQSVIWLIPVYGIFSLYLGDMFDLPDWAKQISPYGWVNDVPAHQVDWSVFGWMTLLGIILFIVSYLAYRRRDMITN